MLFRRPTALVALLFATLFCGHLPAHAHGDLHERILKLTAQIAAQPAEATLLLQRADLRRQHGEFPGALADLDAAAKLKTDRCIILLAQTRVFSDAGQITNALRAADEFLALESNSAEAFTLRARARFKANQVQGAISDFTSALGLSSTPEPDVYLERARVQAALGQLAQAASGLDEGVARLGEVPALQLAAIEYDRQRADFAAAIARVDKLVARHPVKEPWLVLRGEILAQAGRLPDAKAAFQQALSGIENYPTAKRGLEQTIQLQARTREGLARVEARLIRKSNS